MAVRALIVTVVIAAALPALAQEAADQAEPQLVRLSGRRLRRQQLQIRQRRKLARR